MANIASSKIIVEGNHNQLEALMKVVEDDDLAFSLTAIIDYYNKTTSSSEERSTRVIDDLPHVYFYSPEKFVIRVNTAWILPDHELCLLSSLFPELLFTNAYDLEGVDRGCMVIQNGEIVYHTLLEEDETFLFKLFLCYVDDIEWMDDHKFIAYVHRYQEKLVHRKYEKYWAERSLPEEYTHVWKAPSQLLEHLGEEISIAECIEKAIKAEREDNPIIAFEYWMMAYKLETGNDIS